MWKKPSLYKIGSLALLGCLLALLGCSSPKDKNVFIVGLQAGYPPYEYVDAQGKVVGLDVDVAQKIADAMGKKLVIQEMGFDSLILSLKNHKIDAIISGMSITQERLKEIDMVPYFGESTTSLQLLFWQKPSQPIESLQGKKVAVQSGTLQAEILQQHQGIQSTMLENIQELVMDIKYGKSEAMLVEPAIGTELKYKYPEIQSIALPLSPDQQSLGNGIGIAKDQPELNAQVRRILQELKTSGQMEQLKEKWFHGS